MEKKKKNPNISIEVIQLLQRRHIHYVYTSLGELPSQRRLSSLPGGQGPRLLPIGISYSPNPLLCQAATPTQCS